MNIMALTKLLMKHKNTLSKAILSLCVAFSLIFGITVYKQNQKLSEQLKIANNNIEAYQGSLAGSQQANNVLRLDVSNLSQYNDKLVQQIDSVAKVHDIKPKNINTAATQLQFMSVKGSKEVNGDLSNILADTIYITKDSIVYKTYSDSIQYNKYTKAYYTISKDSVNINLDIRNSQYLYTFKSREYKNKKSFLKRLFTLDFKKVDRYKYQIINTNDLIKEDSVKVIERN